MNVQIEVVGRLGKQPEMKYTGEGTPVTTFSVAASFGYGDYKKTSWWRVTTWGKLAEVCNQYLDKGSMVLVRGTPNGDTYENNSGDTVVTPHAYISNDEARAGWALTAKDVVFLETSGERRVNKETKPEDVPF